MDSSTTHRRGRTSKLFALSMGLTISMVKRPIFLQTLLQFGARVTAIGEAAA
jgi:hypothetical protein